jgi:hypothetical protein
VLRRKLAKRFILELQQQDIDKKEERDWKHLRYEEMLREETLDLRE